MQFTFPEAKFGVSCLDYIAFFDLNPASGKVLQAQLRKSYENQIGGTSFVISSIILILLFEKV